MGPEQQLVREPRDERVERLSFLADGVYAIAITLLAIELILPESSAELSGDALFDALWDRRDEVLAFVTSFVFIGNFWFGQLMLLRHVRRFDGRLFWLVLLQLLFVAFMPFPSSLIGRHPSEQVAQLLYFGTVTLTAWSLEAVWAYAVGGRRLVGSDISAAVIRQGHRASLAVAGVFTALFVVIAIGVARSLPMLLLVCLISIGGILMGVFVGDPTEDSEPES